MTKTIRVTRLFAVVLSALLLAAAATRALKAQVTPGATTIGPPPARKVRIGLTTDPVKVRVSAEGGVVVRDPARRAAVWRRSFPDGLYLVSDVSGGEVGLIYRVQIASFTDKGQAEAKQKELEALLPTHKVVLAYHPDRRAWRVRAGEFRTRDEAAALVQRLNDEGYMELWIAEEGQPVSGRRRIRLVDERWNPFLTNYERVLITPVRAGSLVRVNDSTYRGTLEARVDKAGRLQLINEIDMEEYLRGVVPNEMGPGQFPELEALKAQAVAARTYIIANLGQFADDGYDVCDSPQCQVYKGAGTEHPLTNQALEETRGVILTHNGRPINALYTSTCGGHTEDGALVFPEEKTPYLKGVPCYPEVEAESRALGGRSWVDPVVLEDGAPVNEEVSLLHRLGVVGPEALSRAYLLAQCGPIEAQRWTTFALGLLGKVPPASGLPDGALQMLGLTEYLARSLGWDERLRLAVDDRDLPYLLAFKDRDDVPKEAQRAYAVLILEGLLQPFPDNSLRPRHHPSRGLVLRSLYRILDYYNALGRVQATYRGFDGDRVLLEVKRDVAAFPVSPEAALYRSFRDATYPARSVPLTLGDRLFYHLGADGAVDYLKVVTNHRGVSDDRYSPQYRWEKRYTRAELETLLRARVDMGTLKDIEPTKKGVSGRVVELKVTGSRGQFFFRGFRIRTALGILENLFTVDRTLNSDGGVHSYIFSGKGWGHGLGLCQVGAYGMALRGKSYDEILRHYYTGVDLTRRDR
jgi:stage II sporulation protein D